MNVLAVLVVPCVLREQPYTTALNTYLDARVIYMYVVDVQLPTRTVELKSSGRAFRGFGLKAEAVSTGFPPSGRHVLVGR